MSSGLRLAPGRAAVVVVVAVFTALVAPPAAVGNTRPAAPSRPVAPSRAAAPANDIASRSHSQRVHLDIAVALRPRAPAALAAYVQAVSTPGSPGYRHYLTPAQFARRFGPTAAQIAAVRASLRARGLSSGALSAGHLSLSFTAGERQLERAFSLSPRELSPSGRRPGAIAALARTRIAVQAAVATALGARAAAEIQSVVGLDGGWAPQPLLVRPAARAARVPLDHGHVATGGPQPCPAAQQAAPPQSAYTADQIASAYGFAGLYQAGDLGAGVTVAVYELEPDDPTDIAAYQQCYGTSSQISYIPVDGGAGYGAGSGEATLDIENLIGLAPDVNVLVYQGPNSSSGNPGSGPYDTLSAIVNQNRARVVNISWGQCEQTLGRTDAEAENTLFEQAAVQGQSIVAATGDDGAEDCYVPGTAPAATYPAVDDPAGQPLVTGVGGTALTAVGPPPTESVWNGGGTLGALASQPGASGGGVSTLWPMPPAQADAAPSLGVRAQAPAANPCGSATGACRLVPDVAADADPGTGYLIYWNGAGSVVGQGQGWQAIGGTSGAAPVWAALLALADASPACAGTSVGYADPALYRAAGADYGADFNDVTTGNNDYTGTNGGQFAAGPGYDLATGLGTPDATTLAAALCTDAVRIVNPGTQRSTARALVSLQLHATAVAGATVTYAAAALPRGLRLDAATGVIAGRPARAGIWTVRASARDDEGATASQTFTWAVGDSPTISHVALTGTPGRPRLAFVVRAGRGSPPLSRITIALPRSLSLLPRAGVRLATATGPRLRVRFVEAAAPHGSILLTLRAAVADVRVTLAPPSLRARGSLPSSARVQLSVSVTDTDAGMSVLRARVRAPIRV